MAYGINRRFKRHQHNISGGEMAAMAEEKAYQRKKIKTLA